MGRRRSNMNDIPPKFYVDDSIITQWQLCKAYIVQCACILYKEASLGWVSPEAVTQGVTPSKCLWRKVLSVYAESEET